VEQEKRSTEKKVALWRVGQPEDIAYAALVLALGESKYLTGVRLAVDGALPKPPEQTSANVSEPRTRL
jgi:NAD(P)-dependent dehydrogenase (short-subunit alcohol dehydrogenase family)